MLDDRLAGAAAALSRTTEATFYDASCAALAATLNAPLVTADRELLAAGGIPATDFAARL